MVRENTIRFKMIERKENTVYIATISGGKDSVTMCDLLLKNGYPVDYIVFNDTLNEFDEMYEYIEKLKVYFLDRYDKKITVLKPQTHRDFKSSMFRTRVKGDSKGKITGLRNASNPFCEWRRDAKIAPFDRFVKKFKGKYKTYIGITTDETHRTKREDTKLLYPLIDIFKMKELDCKQYLINQDMENPLYRHFNRTGCANCHYQSDKDYYTIWKYYPKVWKFFVDTELEMSNKNTDYKHWFTKYRTCADMEKIFIEADKQGSLFDFSDEPIKDCFCKI